MRTHAEWKVETHIFWATGPTRAATRDFISSAALLVKVMARTSKGEMPCSLISQAMRWVRTRVLPDPAPAMIRSGPPGWVTASRWTGLRSSSSGATTDISRHPTSALLWYCWRYERWNVRSRERHLAGPRRPRHAHRRHASAARAGPPSPGHGRCRAAQRLSGRPVGPPPAHGRVRADHHV